MPGRRVALTALTALLTLLGITSTATAQAPSTDEDSMVVERYVALGDSFTAGPFIPVQRIDPVGCARSTRNYPALIAATLHAAQFTDVSCSGAVTANMAVAQPVPLGSNPPQFDALRADTDLVTVSIGGNDIGFSDMIITCSRLSATDPMGDPCRRQVTAGGSDLYAERIIAVAPKIAGVLRGIRERSPDATVVLVGYLRLLPPALGCWPTVPIARGDVPYLNGLHQQFTKVLAEQASDNGALFTDAYTASWGHDTCQAPWVRWVEGFIPTQAAFPVHPNAEGMRAVADFTMRTLNGARDD